MDIGNLVVDLVSLVIVTSVFTIAVVRTTSIPSDGKRSIPDDLADHGYYGSNPSEVEDDPHAL